MKVLMFGWEFPPHISGGLGTACQGLTKGLVQIDDVEITFVVPKVWGDEDLPDITLLGANRVPVIHRQIQFADARSKIEYYTLRSGLVPYLGTAEFEELKSEITSEVKQFVEVTPEGEVMFEGGYGRNLFQEISYYAIVAEQLACEIDFDLIHVHDWMCFPAGVAARRISGKPLVAHVHSTEFDRSGRSVNTHICLIEKEGLLAADKIIAVSNLTRMEIIQKYDIAPRKVVTIHNAVEPSESLDLKKNCQFAPDKVVSFLGRITAQKGPEYFIEAAALVVEKIKNVRFVMAGKGDMLDEMKKKAFELNLSGYFYFPGFLTDEEVTGLFQISDVFVMSSVSEPFGIVALEAMQLGVPVVISRQSGVSEVVKSAIIVDYWNTKAMADGICTVLTSARYRRRLSGRGKKEADRLVWGRTALKVYETYHKLLKGFNFDVHN